MLAQSGDDGLNEAGESSRTRKCKELGVAGLTVSPGEKWLLNSLK